MERTESMVPVHLNYGGGKGEWTEWPESEVKAMLDAADAAKASRAEQMPDERAALRVMFDGWLRLKELGWRESMYAPADHSDLELIEAGSTGIHRGYRDDDRRFWIVDDDVWPSRAILWRAPLPRRQTAPQERSEG